MDIKRLVIFVIFSFSVMMLWDAWQIKGLPQTEVVATASDASIPEAAEAASIAQVGSGQFKLEAGERIKVSTDLYQAEISTVGGDLRHLVLNKHLADGESPGSFVLMDDGAANPMLYVAQTGLIGADLPNHKTLFSTTANSYAMEDTADNLVVKLTWEGNGIAVDKVYTFHRGSYQIDVDYHVANASAADITPSVYYQIRMIVSLIKALRLCQPLPAALITQM